MIGPLVPINSGDTAAEKAEERDDPEHVPVTWVVCLGRPKAG